jgi:hypothetical protein
MHVRVITIALAAAVALAQDSGEPEGLLDRIKNKLSSDLGALPDYTCQQTIQRWRRGKDTPGWQSQDTLRVEVAFIKGNEQYGWEGAKLGEKELRQITGRGSIGTGSFALHARNIFLRKSPEFTYVGETRLADGRKAIRYDFQVDEQDSAYRVRIDTLEAKAAFRGAFWVHPESLDLVKLAIETDEVAETPISSISDTMEYARVEIAGRSVLLPRASELLVAESNGDQSRNVTVLASCRQYAVESKLSFGEETASAPAKSVEVSLGPSGLPARLVVELALETEIEPERAAVGDEVRAVVARPVRHEEKVLVPEGTVVVGRLVRNDREAQPYPHHVLAMEFHTVEHPSGRMDFRATMEDASGAGVLRVQKNFMPVFDRKRRVPAMSILVREQQKGQGVIHWDAKHARVKRGLKMKWETTDRD